MLQKALQQSCEGVSPIHSRTSAWNVAVTCRRQWVRWLNQVAMVLGRDREYRLLLQRQFSLSKVRLVGYTEGRNPIPGSSSWILSSTPRIDDLQVCASNLPTIGPTTRKGHLYFIRDSISDNLIVSNRSCRTTSHQTPCLVDDIFLL